MASVRGWRRSMTTAWSEQQIALPVSIAAHSCLSFGHCAWLTPGF
jgi:hypothetical protein